MNTPELNTNRNVLIEWIKNLENEKLLNLLNRIRVSQDNKSADWWDNLSKSEINEINQGLQDIENGETLSSKEFWKTVKK